ncbi:uncharacterized protein ATNIH1004_001971 [Aspergillus tanneri]|uniref:Uncharacterized protein n=1 Tax=Aspergillus tanneri TaxID=1220188 RepID=A0A5M9M9Z9_9EURO|nr:uncharacterized protein ATNIH1004_001971 [Aspergillus tanneri]KAA8641369.1 hypothetical protein ATNIH1004_001971 [Aspergillus tanneri]
MKRVETRVQQFRGSESISLTRPWNTTRNHAFRPMPGPRALETASTPAHVSEYMGKNVREPSDIYRAWKPISANEIATTTNNDTTKLVEGTAHLSAYGGKHEEESPINLRRLS